MLIGVYFTTQRKKVCPWIFMTKKGFNLSQNLVVNIKLTLSNDNESSIKGSSLMLLQAEHIKA